MLLFGLAAVALGQDCQGACDRMMTCSGMNTPEIVANCAAECVASGTDAASLAYLEQMICSAAAPAAAAAPATPAAPAPPAAGSVAQAPAAASGACSAPGAKAEAQRYQLLTGTAWCSFSFANGVTKKARAVFSTSGLVTVTDGSESIQSGSAGTYASASGGGQQGCWKLDGQLLSLSYDGTTWAAAPMSLSYNSSGSPIFKAEDGTEYMVCQ